MAINQTDIETWNIEDLVFALGETPNKKKKIKIPKFQRNLVWKDDQKLCLIDSLKRGFPVGALLLFRSGKIEGDCEVYDLIDGLQRSSTLRDYVSEPTAYYESTKLASIGEQEFKDLHASLNVAEISTDHLQQEVVRWMRTLSGFEEQQGFSAYRLMRHLGLTMTFQMPEDEMIEVLESLLAKVRKDSDISDFKVPVLIFSGDQHDLATVFERLNSQGTKLTKYQVFAAAWQAHPSISITNQSIIEFVKKKYDALIEEGYDIEGYDPFSPGFNTSQFSYFEYLFGLGKLLISRFDQLFSGAGPDDKEDSVGFNIANICLGLKFSEMAKLPTELGRHQLQSFENAVLDAVETVFSILKGYIGIRMNKRQGNLVAHSELQIVSMIGKVFNEKYDRDLNIQVTWKSAHEQLKKSLPYHYLYDILREQWKGSVDTKAFELARLDNDTYKTRIGRRTWENALEDWFTNELAKKERKRVSTKAGTVLFLKYIYTHLLSAKDEISDRMFDIEHLVPVEKLKNIAGDDGIPISAFPNLCLMDATVNRKKGNETYYEYFDRNVREGDLLDEQAKIEIEKIEAYSFTSREDLDFATSNLTREAYLNYLKLRFEKIRDRFLELNEIND